MQEIYWVYLIECNNGHFYTGYTNDLLKRYQKHCEGTGAKYTKSFEPIRIAQQWEVESKSLAMKAECLIKKLSKSEKEKLIKNPEWL